MKVRAHLTAMAVVILVPVTALWGLALNVLLDEQERAAHEELRAVARSTSLAVERELAVTEMSLRVLATSANIANGDWAAFHQQALVARTRETAWILLFDRDGQQIVNTRFPLGQKLPRRVNPERVARVLATGKPSVSDIYLGALTRRPIVTVDVPVPIAGSPRYVLTQSFFPEYFDEILRVQDLPSGWSIRLADAAGATIASRLPPASRDATHGSGWAAPTEGETVESRAGVEGSGWTVSATAPVELLGGPARRALTIAALGVLGALCVAFLFAIELGRRLARSLSSVVHHAVEGTSIRQRPASGIDEIDELHRVLSRMQGERERLLESEKAARTLAEAQNRSKDDFLAMLAHEVRNPLSAISGAAAVMGAAGRLPDAVSHAREVIERQTRHLRRMVEDLIDTRRLASGKVHVEPERVDLAEAARRCVTTLDAVGENRQHVLALRTEPAWVDADPTRLEQIINNLLVNAVKYTPGGGRIEVGVAAIDGHATLTVRDEGVGMTPELAARIFEPFVQGSVEERGAAGGLGIGLAVVQQLARLHGGEVAVASEGRGRGTTFTVRLPLRAAPAAESPMSYPSWLAGRRVLVAARQEGARRAMRDILERHGCLVLEAGNGQEALRVAAREVPALALIDECLEEPDGYEVARALTASPTTREICLVALVAGPDEWAMQRAVDAGFDDHLPIPVAPERLLEVVEKACTGD